MPPAAASETTRGLMLLVAPLLIWQLINGALSCFLWDLGPVAWLAADVLGFVLLPLAVMGLGWRWGWITPAGLGLRWDGVRAADPLLLLIFVAVVDRLYQGWAWQLGLPSARLVADCNPFPDAPLALLLYGAITAGVIEELVYRGLFWRLCARFSRPDLLYLGLGPLLFALVHWEQGLPGLLRSWLFGLLFAALYRWRAQLWPLIAAHILIDVADWW